MNPLPVRFAAFAVIAVLLFASACGNDSPKGPVYSVDATPQISSTPTVPPATSTTAAGPSASATAPATMKLTSPAFVDGANIPPEYSCDGKSSSPEIAWTGAPAAAKAFALVLHDPDAPRSGGFTHWVLYDVPAGTTKLDTAVSPGGKLPAGALEGANGSGRPGYTGPCPPKGGPPHHYQFTLFALDAPLALDPGKTKDDLEQAVKGHVLATAGLTGLFAH